MNEEEENLRDETADRVLSSNEVAEIYDKDARDHMSETSSSADEEASGDVREAEDYVDDSIQGFFEHGDSVFSIATSPTNPNLCATGGGDDIGYLWDVSSGAKLGTLTGHTDSITSIEFSSDGNYLASAGMDGLIRIWKVPTAEFVTVLEAGSEVMWISWHPKGLVLLAGTSDSTLWMWSLPRGDVMYVMAGHTDSVTDGSWTGDGKQIVSCSADGSIILWDPKTGGIVRKIETMNDARLSPGPDGWICLGVSPNSQTITVGASTGVAKVLNLNNGQLLGSLETQNDSLEAIRYFPTLPLMAIASIDGSIALYEVPSLRLRAKLEHEDAVVSLHFEAGTPFLFSCSTDRTVRKWDVRTCTEVKRWKGHQDSILCMAVQTGGKKVITAGDDRAALVFGTE